jgi:hypothetical protein
MNLLEKLGRMSMIDQREEEKEKLIQECLRLLKKISRHRYSIKLLSSAKHALETIANYKPSRLDKRRTHQESSTKLLTIPPKKNE